MGTVRYTVIDGEVIAEKRNGVRKLYVPDPLGSTVALLDSTQAQTDTFSYWPYGEDAGRTGSTPTPFRYVGTLGYYRDSSTRDYVRARFLDVQKGRWITEDPISAIYQDIYKYIYVITTPLNITDSSGMRPDRGCGEDPDYCQTCADKGQLPSNNWHLPQSWLNRLQDAITKYCGNCQRGIADFTCQIYAESGGDRKLAKDWYNGELQKGLFQISKSLWDANCKDLGPFEPNWQNPYKNIVCAVRHMCQQQKNKCNPCGNGRGGWGTDCRPGHGYDCCLKCTDPSDD